MRMPCGKVLFNKSFEYATNKIGSLKHGIDSVSKKSKFVFSDYYRSSFDISVDVIQKLMSCRAIIDNQHDLPVYQRIFHILTYLTEYLHRFNIEEQLSYRSLAQMILDFDVTYAVLVGTLLIKTAQNRDDLESMLLLLEQNLSKKYFTAVVGRLATVISKTIHVHSYIS